MFSTLRQQNYSPYKDIVLTHAYYLSLTSQGKKEMQPQAPLPPLYVASYLRTQAYKVSFYDTTFQSGPEAFESYLIKERPPLIGIYVEEHTRHHALRMAAACKEEGIAVIAFGPGAYADAQKYLECNSGLIAGGEAEETISTVLNALKDPGASDITALPGVRSQEKNSGVRYVEELDAIPFPARDLVDYKPYFSAWRGRHGIAAMHMSVCRGTAERCALSYNPALTLPLRLRSPKNVAAEQMFLKIIYGPDKIIFTDDAFVSDSRWLGDLCRELSARHARLPFECAIRPDRAHQRYFQLLKEAGCAKVWVRTVSGSQKILDELRAGFGVYDIRHAARLARAAGIELGLNVTLGHPAESEADIELTRALVREIGPNECKISVVSPVKGTAFYEQTKTRLLPVWHAGRADDETILTYRSAYSQNYYDAARLLISEEAALRREEAGLADMLRYGISRFRYELMRQG